MRSFREIVVAGAIALAIGCCSSPGLGQTQFGPPIGDQVAINPADTGATGEFDVAMSGGMSVVVWTTTDSLGDTIGDDRDVLYSRSTDGGATWSTPAPLNTDAARDAHFDVDVKVAGFVETPGDETEVVDLVRTWIVAWSRSGDVVVSRSVDGGATWSPAASLGPGREPDVATDGEGVWITTWNEGGDVWWSRSTDDGQTWSPAVAAGREDLRDGVSIAAGKDGTWVRAWYERLDDWDTYVSRSGDDGLTWSEPEKLSEQPFLLSFSVTLDPSLFVGTTGSGVWVIAWPSGLRRSVDDGATWSVIEDTLPSSIGIPFSTAIDASGALAVTFASGVSDNLVGIDRDVRLGVSLDQAATWTEPFPLNSDAIADTIRDFRTRIATDHGGRWVVVTARGSQPSYRLESQMFELGDCNDNGVLDAIELASGAAQDVNGNATPDECEPDCDGNGLPDLYETINGLAADCDVDTVPDVCQPAGCLGQTPSSCEITADFRIDDGTSDGAWVVTSGSPVWAVAYDAGSTATIRDVTIGLVGGDGPAAVTVLVWDDPNDDGMPDDAIELRRVDATINDLPPSAAYVPVRFQTVAIPPVEVNGRFFVGFFTPGNRGIASDFDTPEPGRNWFASGRIDADPTVTFRGAVLFEDPGSPAPPVSLFIRANSNDANSNQLPDVCELPGCPGDIAVPPGEVDIDDLLVVINDWNCTGAAGTCLGDVSGAIAGTPDGVVDTEDLLFVISSWGSCPAP